MKVLFLCVANSARSQMAEGLARHMAPEGVQVESAGSRPSTVRPEAVTVLADWDIDISMHRSKGLEEIDFSEVSYAITLCAEEECPLLPPGVRHLHWPVEDPAVSAQEPQEERLARFREARNTIRGKLERWGFPTP